MQRKTGWLLLLTLSLAACNGKENNNGEAPPKKRDTPPQGETDPPPPTTASRITIEKKTYPLLVVSLIDGREALSQKPDGFVRLVVFPHDRYQYWKMSAGWMTLFLTKDDQIAEFSATATGGGTGITSMNEYDRALLVPEIRTIKFGSTVHFERRSETPVDSSLGQLKLGKNIVLFERSATPEERYMGLMWRERMSKNDGMLFVYPEPSFRSFWMGNCLLDLDIAFFREDQSLINVVEMDRYPDPSEDPGDRARSEEEAMYVLELNQGWFRKRNLVDAEGRPVRPLRFEILP